MLRTCTFAAHQRRAFHLMMRGGGSDEERSALLAHVVEILDAAQVHQMLGRSQAELHHGDQAHAAGQGFGAFRQQAQRFVQSLGCGVFELLGNHAGLPAEITFHSFSGVSGMSR
jgi:hypothetical protein